MVAVCIVLAACAALISAGTSRLDGAGAAPPESPPAAGARQELVAERTENSRTFREADGSNLTTLSATPLNYRDAAGDWQPIDNTLHRAADGTLENGANDFRVTLPETADEPLMVAHEGATVGFTLLGADDDAAGRADGAEATFQQALPGVTAIYEAKADSLKETLLLASAAAPARYEFALDAPGLTAAVEQSGDVVLDDAAGKERFRLLAPWMQDAAGVLSRAAAYELATVNGQQRLVLRLDESWLGDPTRAFPVAVDPTVTGEPDGVCTLVSGASANTADCSANGPVWVGRDGGKVHRAAIAIPDSSDVVNDETLVIDGWIDYRVLSRGTSANSELEVYGLKRDIADGATWNRATPTTAWTTPGGDLPPQRESKRSLYTALVGRRVRQSIPRHLQREVENRQPSNAILIKSTNENADHLDALEDFTVNIRWHDRFGLGSQYSYEHLDLPGGMGADVNLGSGNIVLRQAGPSLTGYRGRPLATRFWNSYASGEINTYGTGEEGDFGSIAIEEQADHSSLLFGFSGVEGVFVQRHDGSFEPPAGLPAVMREHADGSYTLFFEDTNETWTFSDEDPHRLVRAEDAYGYALEAEYDEDGDINLLTGSDGATIEYGFDGIHPEPSTIEGPDGGLHRYTYDAGGDVATYTAPGGAVTRYTRDGDDRVTLIEWADGSELEIEYAGNWWPELTFTGPGGTPREELWFTGSDGTPGYTDVHRNAEPVRRSTFDPGLFAVSESRLPTAATTLALSGRLATNAGTTLAAGVHPLTFTAGDAGGVARVEIEVDGAVERTWAWDCSVSCARSQSATWNLNTADFPPGEHVVRVIVTAAGGERRAEAVRVAVAYSATVISPRTRTQPTIAGRAAEGEILTASIANWVGAHPTTFQPQWRRCNAVGAACQDIAGENDWRYTATAADVGATLVVTVRGRNGRGVGSSTSAAFGPIVVGPPVNVQLPELVGRPTVLLSSGCAGGRCPPDGTLAIDDGVWNGSGPISLAYQWETCATDAPSSCTAIAGANGATYDVPDSFTGWMRVSVTATSPHGTAAASSPVRPIEFAPTTFEGEVGFTGSARVGELLTASVPDASARWTAQWLRCNAAGGDCRAIAGATAESYLLTVEDLGARLRVRITYHGVNLDDSGVSGVVRGSLLVPRRFAAVLDGEELWTAKLDGSDARKIHAVSYADDLKDVAVSPDGDTVAMVTTRGIELVGANGRGRRLLLEAPSAGGVGSGPQSPSSIAFSPSGDTLIFGAYSPVDFATGIYTLDVATAVAARLDAGWSAEVPFTDRSLPSYSPRGDRITYLATNGSQTAIVTAAANGRGEVAVELGAHVEEGTVTSKPRISEEGDTVIFSGRPLGDCCGEAVFGIDLATQVVELRSWWRNCDDALTRPSWTGPGDTVLVASSDDVSGGGVATSVKLADLATGELDVLLPDTDKPVTALELPQTSVPVVAVHGISGDGMYTNGVDPLEVTVTASDRGVGVQNVGYGPTFAAPIAITAVPCESLCPEEVEQDYSIATSGLPAGVTSYEAGAQNAAGTIGRTPLRVLVDRTGPLGGRDPRVLESDATARTAEVWWWPATDPEIAPGVPGSGVYSQEVWWTSAGASSGGWIDGSDGAIAVHGASTGSTVQVRFRVTDEVGNVTETAYTSVDWAPPPFDPDSEIRSADFAPDYDADQIEGYGEGGSGALRSGDGRCEGGFGQRAPRRPTYPELEDYRGEYDSVIEGAAVVVCPGVAPISVTINLCVRMYVDGVWTVRGRCSQTKKFGLGINEADVQIDCRGGEQSYRLSMNYHVDQPKPWPDFTTPTVMNPTWRTYSCNNDGAWRNAAKRDSSAPSKALGSDLRGIGEPPPANARGGYTANRPSNGFEAHHIVPATSRRAWRAQGIAWLCGLGETGGNTILINAAANGIYLRGTELRKKGDGGVPRNSGRYTNLSQEGKDRAYHPDTYGDAYMTAIANRLDDAFNGSSCRTSGEQAAARRILASIKSGLADGDVPGK